MRCVNIKSREDYGPGILRMHHLCPIGLVRLRIRSVFVFTCFESFLPREACPCYHLSFNSMGATALKKKKNLVDRNIFKEVNASFGQKQASLYSVHALSLNLKHLTI